MTTQRGGDVASFDVQPALWTLQDKCSSAALKAHLLEANTFRMRYLPEITTQQACPLLSACK
jgi:hypothetical protein